MYSFKSANICLHKSTNEKVYPFCESDTDLCVKIRENKTGGLLIVFTRKAAVDKTFIRDSSNICQSIVGIEAGQLTPTQYVKIFQQDCIQDRNLVPISENSRLEITDLAIFRVWSYLFTKKQDKVAKLKAPGNQKKIDCFNVDSDCDHCKKVFEAMGCYYHFCPYPRSRPSLCGEDIEPGNKMCEIDYLRRE